MPKSHLDSGSCIRHSYSHDDEALRIIPSSNTSFAIELDADDGDSVQVQPRNASSSSFMSIPDATQSADSAVVNVSKFKGFAVQVDAQDISGSGTIEIHGSVDGATFIKVSEHNFSGSMMIQQSDVQYMYFQVKYSAGTVSSGSIAMEYSLKG